MSDNRKMLARTAVFLALASAACARQVEPDLAQIHERINAACADGSQRLPASQIFEREAKLCYAYETVQDRPIVITVPHYVDRDHIRGEDRVGGPTFDLPTTVLATADGASVRFYDVDFQCQPTDAMIAVRDDSQAYTQGGCGWLIGTNAEINHWLSRSKSAAGALPD
jgi:hypothetical protein